jgi:hypothetical protein
MAVTGAGFVTFPIHAVIVQRPTARTFFSYTILLGGFGKSVDAATNPATAPVFIFHRTDSRVAR